MLMVTITMIITIYSRTKGDILDILDIVDIVDVLDIVDPSNIK